MPNSLFNLARDKNYWTTLSFLLNNEENIEKRIKLFELICKSDLNASIIIADSFFIDADCNQLINIVYNKILKYTDINTIKNLSKSRQSSLYVCFLTFNFYDNAKCVIEELVDKNIKRNIFPIFLFEKYFSQRWIKKHIFLLMKLNMWTELNKNLNSIIKNNPDFIDNERKAEVSLVFKKMIDDKEVDFSNATSILKFLMSFDLLSVFYDSLIDMVRYYELDESTLHKLMRMLFFRKKVSFDTDLLNEDIFNYIDYLNVNDWGINDKIVKSIAEKSSFVFISPYRYNKMFKRTCDKLILILINKNILINTFEIKKYNEYGKDYIKRIDDSFIREDIDDIFELYYKIRYDEKFFYDIYINDLKQKKGYWNIVTKYRKIMINYIDNVVKGKKGFK